jgi:hypothetical protein
MSSSKFITHEFLGLQISTVEVSGLLGCGATSMGDWCGVSFRESGVVSTARVEVFNEERSSDDVLHYLPPKHLTLYNLDY